MGWEQLPPETPAWRQEFNACSNCERLEAENSELKKKLSAFSSATPSYINGLRDELEETQFKLLVFAEDNQHMINLAGEAIGTDPSLRSSACVKVLVDHIKTLRAELERCMEFD